jgi:hypothetical protein
VKIKLLLLSVCFSLFLLCWLSPEAIAAPGVTIAPASDSVYALQGTDLSDASGMDITIRYDPSALAGPQVVQGGLIGGALMAINASTPGMIRLALVRVTAISGSGTIATITFTRLNSTGADILSLVSSVINSAGRNIPVTSQVLNSVKTADSGASTDQKAGQSTGGTSPSPESGTPGSTATAPTGVVGMVVPVPGAPASDVQSANSSTGQPASDLQQPAADAIATLEAAKDSGGKMIAKAVEPERKKIKMYQSVLERFKDFKGKKTPKTLMALFQEKEANQQDPPVVLSNGKATVKIVLELDSRGNNNNFLLDGVSLVSLKNKEKDLWVLELLPDSMTYEATVSVPRNNQWYVVPLTVAPPMDVNISSANDRLTETDFKRFLKEQGTAKAPRFDLNKDGRRDYVDDFIFTANYLVQQDSHAKQEMKVRK